MEEFKMKETNKWINVVAYFIFFVPILVDGENTTYKFHANQGLLLLLLSVAVGIVGSIIPFIGWFLILPVGGIFVFVLAIIGIMNAYMGIEKQLPLIGKFKIIK